MTATILFGIFALTGIWLMVVRPLAKTLKIAPYWEIGAGTLFVIFFAIHLTTILVMSPAMEEELAKRPCGPSSPQGRCYSLERPLCESAWQGAESQCKSELAGLLKERPTALIGPALNRCRARKMDQVLRYNRTNTDSEYCKAYFEVVEGK